MRSPRHRVPFVILSFCTPRSSFDVSTIARRASSVAAALTLLFTLPAPAANPQKQQLPLLVERALETMENSAQDGYAYKMVRVDEGKSLIAHFDPAKPAGTTWDLLQKEGRKPTAKEIETFRKERADREKRRAEQKKKDPKKGGGGDRDLRAMIDPASVRLISETTQQARYRFRMASDDDEAKAMVESILGTLVISKAAPHVESLELASTGEMKPLPGVKISEVHLTLTFFTPDAQGRSLPATVRSVIKGRAMLVKKIDEDMSVTFSEYARRQTSGTPTSPAH